MQWKNLTAADFTAAARDTGVCVLALGVLEKHSEHLPLGTDMLAAAREPAVVFPPFYFGQIYEARAFPGTLTLAHLERVPAQPADPLKRMSHLPSAYAGIWWYADYPDHYAGDARPASAEKGRVLEDVSASALARFIAAVKSDQSVPGLEQEFLSR